MSVYEQIYSSDQLEVIESSDDVYWLGADGDRYLDLLSGGGAFFLWKYGDKRPKQIFEQFSDVFSTSNFMMHPAKRQLAESLTELTEYPLIYFLSSGSEANDAAIKMAFKHNCGKKYFLYSQGSYFGRTMGAVKCSTPVSYSDYLPEDYVFLPLTWESLGIEDIAGIIIEGAFPQRSLNPWNLSDLSNLIEHCKKNGIVTIVDEIRSGLGKTGRVLFSDYLSVRPDIVTLGKTLCSGMPLSAVLMDEKFKEDIDYYWHSSTSGGNPMLCALSDHLINPLFDISKICEIDDEGKEFAELLEESICLNHTRIGKWFNLFVSDAREVARRLREKGVLVYNTDNEVITLFPSMFFTLSHWEIFVEKLKGALNERNNNH